MIVVNLKLGLWDQLLPACKACCFQALLCSMVLFRGFLSWGPQTPGHRPSGLHLAPLLAGSEGRAGGAAEAQAEPRTGQRAW